MALKLNFSVCTENSCKNFTFIETTGTYDATTNPTGWGAPNSLIAWATAATLDIYKPGNTTTTPDLTIDLFAVTPDNWPTTDNTLEYLITNTVLGVSGKLTDGFWKFVYSVTVQEVDTIKVYKQTKYIATTCNAKCCVDGLFAEIEDFECDCMEAAINKAITAQAIYKAMESAGKCGNLTKFNKLKSMLTRMCNNQDCCS